MGTKGINLDRPFHPESLWGGLKNPMHDDYEGLTYDQARHQWRMAQTPYVLEQLAAEYKKLRKAGTPHEEIDEACYDGYLEYVRRWPVKSKSLRAEVAQIDNPQPVSERPSHVQPNDEVDKGNEAIQSLPDELPDRNDDSIIAADLMRAIVAGIA